MTRKEAAIKSCEDRIKRLENAPVHYYGKRRRERAIELERVKIDALTPPTQEQVEKVWRGEWMPVGDDAFYSKCSKCGKMAVGKRLFCPNCGAPMTDEAVEMVMERMEALMERMEALKDGKTD